MIPRDIKLALCSLALVEGAALMVLAVLTLYAYRESSRLRHVAGMAIAVLGTVGGVVIRMWDGGMDDDPWMIVWFTVMFGMKLYFLWWFYERRVNLGRSA